MRPLHSRLLIFTKKPVDFSYAIYEIKNLIGLYVKVEIIYSVLSIWWKISVIKDDFSMYRFPRVQYVKGDFKARRFFCVLKEKTKELTYVIY